MSRAGLSLAEDDDIAGLPRGRRRSTAIRSAPFQNCPADVGVPAFVRAPVEDEPDTIYARKDAEELIIALAEAAPDHQDLLRVLDTCTEQPSQPALHDDQSTRL
jgi:hypothetical protein